MLVVGRNEEQADWLAEQLGQNDYFVEAVVYETDLATFERLASKAEAVAIGDGVPDRAALVSACERGGKSVLLVPDTADLLLHSARTTRVNDVLLYETRQPGLTSTQRVIKRALDIALTLAMVPVAGPLILILAAAIRMSSAGPIFFRQERIGERGRRFEVLKLRTMNPLAEARTGPVMAADDDPRVTRIGRFLRATHLDELPQLLNVLRGEMSIIGPRPERPCFASEFERAVENYELRNVVKPGITGLAQVRGRYHTSAMSKLRFDLTYILDYSLMLDVKILLLTVAKLFDGISASSRTSASIPIGYRRRYQTGD